MQYYFVLASMHVKEAVIIYVITIIRIIAKIPEICQLECASQEAFAQPWFVRLRLTSWEFLADFLSVKLAKPISSNSIKVVCIRKLQFNWLRIFFETYQYCDIFYEMAVSINVILPHFSFFFCIWIYQFHNLIYMYFVKCQGKQIIDI